MSNANKSDEAVCFAALEGGEKSEPSVSPARLIDRLKVEAGYIDRTYRESDYRRGLKDGLSRAIQIIQANEGS